MNENPIHVFAKWKVKPGSLDTVLQILKDLHAKSTGEKGNLFYKLYQDNYDPDTLILYEGYADETALTFHRNAPYYVETVVEKMPALLAEREVHLTSPKFLNYEN